MATPKTEEEKAAAREHARLFKIRRAQFDARIAELMAETQPLRDAIAAAEKAVEDARAHFDQRIKDIEAERDAEIERLRKICRVARESATDKYLIERQVETEMPDMYRACRPSHWVRPTGWEPPQQGRKKA